MTSMMLVAGWAFVLLAAVSADSEVKVYKKVGDDVVLKLASPVTDTITSILWGHGPDIAVLWNGMHTVLYRQFKDRGSLNTQSGELTMTGLTREDGGLYTPEINSVITSPTHLFIISPVATPTVNKSCDNETSCILTCDGATTDAEPLTYTWRLGDKVSSHSTKEQLITKEGYSSVIEFSCELENPISQERSQPIPNPFIPAPEKDTTGNLKISTGLTVFICLLAAVLLLVLFHRWKAGMWFFQKETMPWDAGFWSNNDRQTNPARDDAESNGTTARQMKEQTGEETPMT